MRAPQEGALSKWTIFFYGLPALPIAAAGVPIAVYVAPLYSSKDIGIDLALVGTIIMLSRLWDGVTDPLIGRLSDRFRSPIGRRKPWLIAGAPLTMLAIYYLFLPPDGASPGYLLFWIVAFYTGWTMVTLPFGAWGAELSHDYFERSRVAGGRELWQLAGTIVSVAVPGIAYFAFDIAGVRSTVQVLGWTVILLFPVCVGLATLLVPDRAHTRPREIDWREGLRIIWRNGPFKRLLLAFTIQGMGRQFVAILFVLYTAHVIGAPNAAPLVLLLYFGAGILGVPLWIKVADRIGKHRAWLISMFVYNVPLACALPLGQGDIYIFTAIAGVAGLSVAAGTVLPLAMKADVIDLDTLRSREQRAGLFFALWGIADKLAVAVAAFVALWLLDLFGFDPKIDNGEGALWALTILYLIVPGLFSVPAAFLIWRYPITSIRHKRLRERLATRNARDETQTEAAAVGATLLAAPSE